MLLPPNFLSPEDQAEYDAYMARFSEVNHYYEHCTVPVIDWFLNKQPRRCIMVYGYRPVRAF